MITTESEAAGLLSNKEGYIFDLDGVLVDTAKFHYQAWRRMARSLGFDVSEAQNEQLKGVSRMESLDRILAWGNVHKSAIEKEAMATQKNTWYLELVNEMTVADILPGGLEFLRAAQAAAKRIALGSASKNASLILEKTGLSVYFDAVVDGNSVDRSKPDPEVFLKAADALGLPTRACLVFEDAQAGIDAAKAGGMQAIAIGLNPLNGAKLQVKDLSCLLPIISDLTSLISPVK